MYVASEVDPASGRRHRRRAHRPRRCGCLPITCGPPKTSGASCWPASWTGSVRSPTPAACSCLVCRPGWPVTCASSSCRSATSAGSRRPAHTATRALPLLRPRRHSRSAPTYDVFRVESKRLAHKELRSAAPESRRRSRSSSTYAGCRACRCAASRSTTPTTSTWPAKTMIPTHNSTLGLDIARSASIKHNMTTCIFSLEMSRNEITMRLLSAEARVAAAPHAHRQDDRRRLGPAGPPDGRGLQRAAVHRRLARTCR